MMPIVIDFVLKNWRVLASVIIVAGTYLYAHHTGYSEGLNFELDIHMKYVADQEKLVQEAQQLKIAKEQDDANKTKQIIAGYDASVSTLAQRLRDLQAVSGGSGVQVASTGRPIEPVSTTSTTSGRVNATIEAKSSTALSIDPSEALMDTNQCEALQNWEKSIASPLVR